MQWARFSCTRQKKTLNEKKAGLLDLLSRVSCPVLLICKGRNLVLSAAIDICAALRRNTNKEERKIKHLLKNRDCERVY